MNNTRVGIWERKRDGSTGRFAGTGVVVDDDVVLLLTIAARLPEAADVKVVIEDRSGQSSAGLGTIYYVDVDGTTLAGVRCATTGFEPNGLEPEPTSEADARRRVPPFIAALRRGVDASLPPLKPPPNQEALLPEPDLKPSSWICLIIKKMCGHGLEPSP